MDLLVGCGFMGEIAVATLCLMPIDPMVPIGMGMFGTTGAILNLSGASVVLCCGLVRIKLFVGTRGGSAAAGPRVVEVVEASRSLLGVMGFRGMLGDTCGVLGRVPV